jgi:hypothetical protein
MEEDIVNQINSFRENYYNNSSKNIFFKKSQKMDCAMHISNNFDLGELIKRTCYFTPDNKGVFFEYPIFKLFANESNYENIINYVVQLFDFCIMKNNELRVYINLDGLTVSGVERYKPIIMMFFNKCDDEKRMAYANTLAYWKILNTPTMIDMIKNIVKPLVPSYIMNKVILISKKDTVDYMRNMGYIA